MTIRVIAQVAVACFVFCMLISAPAFAEPDIMALYPDCIKLHSPADAPVRQAACERATRDPSLSQHMHATAYYGLAISLRAQNKIDLAISNFQQAIRLYPEALYFHLELARVYFDRGDMKSVLAEIERELANDDLEISNRTNLGGQDLKNRALVLRVNIYCKLGQRLDAQRDIASWHKMIADIERDFSPEKRPEFAAGVASFKALSPPVCDAASARP